MNTIDELHSKAMDIADDAFIARRKGKLEQAKQLSKEALEYEKQAALLLINEFEIEPTRSVLFRSAGWLAFNAEEYKVAEEMIAYALKGLPPFEIKEELDELSKAINLVLKNFPIVENFVIPEVHPYFFGDSNFFAANDENYKFAMVA